MFDLFTKEPPKVEQTPIEQVNGGYYLKRDDLFSVAGVQGGKARTCWFLSQGAVGLVTAGSRSSPQANIVAHIAKELNIPCRVHTPQGELSPELLMAQDAGAIVVQHRAGYNNVIIARAEEDAKARHWTNIPFGMQCWEAVYQTSGQVANLPKVNRLVMPVGSGMSLAGVLQGLRLTNQNIPVVGVCVGADPTKRLNQFAPSNWRDMALLVPSGTDYHHSADDVYVGDVLLDPHYEAKCRGFLRSGDLLWIVGIRKSAAPKN